MFGVNLSIWFPAIFGNGGTPPPLPDEKLQFVFAAGADDLEFVFAAGVDDAEFVNLP